jgi:hypothetical protein
VNLPYEYDNDKQGEFKMNKRAKEITQEQLIALVSDKCNKPLFMMNMRPVRHFMMVTYKSSNDKEMQVPAFAIEGRYKFTDQYKIEFKALNEGFGTETFYVSDLVQMINKGQIQMYAPVVGTATV